MEITVRDVNEVKVVHLYGKLDSATAPEAQSLLTGLINGGGKKILLNCEGLDYISSAGLRVILSAAKLLAAGGGLRVCNLNETVQQIFTLSGFNRMIKVSASESEALIGFS